MADGLTKWHPADDWPGIPGAGWGMGSRVEATVPMPDIDGPTLTIRNCRMTVRGMVVGASDRGPEEWEIAVRDGDGRLWRCLPSGIRSALPG